MATPKIKQGESFVLNGQYLEDDGITPKALTGVILESQIRDGKESFVVTLQIDVLNEIDGLYKISAPLGTIDWPVGNLYYDIKESFGDVIRISDTNTLIVEKSQTRI